MKVTVCFRDIKVVVPCGDGTGLVKDLLEEAIARYRKAQSVDSCCLSLKTVKLLLCDGGILDHDDKIIDVIDDKEQIKAIADGKNNQLLREHGDNNGDGTSGSSLGTCSPDIFCDDLGEQIYNGKMVGSLLADGCHNVIITELDFLAESGLYVRRGSEPALCMSSDLESSSVETSAGPPTYGEVRKNAGNRKEPLGSNLKIGHSTNSGQMVSVKQTINAATRISEDQEHEQDEEIIVVLPKSKEALGIHVVPEFDQAGRSIALLIEKIERGGRADRDHRLQKGDKIIEINFQKLFQVDFPKAQEIFCSALLAPELQIKLLRPSKSTPQSVFEHKDQHNSESVEQHHLDATKGSPPAVPARSPKTRVSSKAARLTMQTIPIELIKGAGGLGFSVTTHGISDSGCCSIYIKNIFPVGAAIEGGHLKPGDVLLEINGVPLGNRTKTEAVRLLRDVAPGCSVQLLVSRALTPNETALPEQTELDRRPAMQNPLPPSGFHPTSTSSRSGRTEEEDTRADKGPEHVDAKENLTSNRKFGSMSNIAKSGLKGDFDDEEDPDLAANFQTGGHPVEKLGRTSTLQKSRKSVSMDDLRRSLARSGVEVSFDDDVDFSATPFHKMRDFNQSIRDAVIDRACNRPARGAGAESAEYIAAIGQIEKLKLNRDKKNKGKKEPERGSGRKFGWLFRFGKGRKSDNEHNRATPSDVPSGRDIADGMKKPPVVEPPSTKNGTKSVALRQHPSHLSGHSRHLSEPVMKETEIGSVPLHKEDYMITPVLPQQDRSRIYAQRITAGLTRDEPRSYQRQQGLGDHWHDQSRHYESVTSRRAVQSHRPLPSHVHLESPLLAPGNIYLDWAYPKTAVPNQRFYHYQGISPSGGDCKPPLKYDDCNPGLRSYQEHHLQFIKPNPGELSPQREMQPFSRLGHYYRQGSFEGQDPPVQYQHLSPLHNQDPTWYQCPLDLSQYAVKVQDRAEVGYGHRGREDDFRSRHQINSDLKIPRRLSSVYIPRQGIATNSDFAREQVRQMHRMWCHTKQRHQSVDYHVNATFVNKRW